MNFSSNSRLFLSFLLLNFFILGCSKSDDVANTDGTDDNPVLVSTVDVKTMEIVTIEVGGNVSEDEYSGTISAREVTIARVDENNVMFMVPADMEEGVAELTVPNLDLEITYDISQASLREAPEEVFNTLYETATTEIAAFDDSPEAQYVANYWVQLKESFDNATEPEQEAMALYYSVNQTLFDNNLTDDNTREQDSNYITLTKKLAAVAVMGTGAVMALSAKGNIRLRAIGVGMALVGAYKAVQLFSLLSNQSLKVINFDLNDNPSEVQRNQETDLHFTHDSSRTLTFEIMRRPINSSDANDANENMVKFFTSYSLYNGIMIELNEMIKDIHNNLFMIEHTEFDLLQLQDLEPTTESVTSDIYENLTWAVAGDEAEIKEVNFDEELTITLTLTDAENLEENYVDTNLKYSYNDTFNDFSGSFPVRVKKPVYKVVTLSGASLPSPLELINNTPKELKLVDENGTDIEDFDISKLAVTNINNSEVALHVQQNGAFNGDTNGEYIELIPLTDEEEADVSFDLVYDGILLGSFDAVVKQRGNGFVMDGEFYPLSLGFIDGEEILISSADLTTGSVDDIMYPSSSSHVISLWIPTESSPEIPDGTYNMRSGSDLSGNPPEGYAYGDLSFEIVEGVGTETYEIISGEIEVQNEGNIMKLNFHFSLDNGEEVFGYFHDHFSEAAL